MLSTSYNKIFRPWDNCDTICEKQKNETEKRENKLRKIRGKYTKRTVDQDNTITTTTEEEIQTDAFASLNNCCDRLLQAEVKSGQKDQPKIQQTSFAYDPYILGYPNFIPDAALQNEALLYESLAQNYAIEMEYARILHEESQTKLLNKKQRPKKYKCPHCNVGFSNNGQLKGHVRIHTGERPYKCEEKTCGKTFTRNEELTRHKRIHSGVRPYPCGTCGKKFGRRDHLKKHTKTHLVQAERMMPAFLPIPMAYPYVYGY